MQDGYGKIIGKVNLPTYLNASGVFTLGESLNLIRQGRWPGGVDKHYDRREYTEIGDARFIVPDSISIILVEMWSAGGGSFPGSHKGGASAYLKFLVEVSPGEVLSLIIGECGSGGERASLSAIGGGGKGGYDKDDLPGVENTLRNSIKNGFAASGAGASQIWRGRTLLAIAGAGGAAGTEEAGGDGGIKQGGHGSSQHSGKGGTQEKGGEAGFISMHHFYAAMAGEYLQGGNTGSKPHPTRIAGGGGGSGYYGGGAGGREHGNWGPILGSGGAGSSYYDQNFTKLLLAEAGSDGIPGGRDSPNWDGRAGYGALACPDCPRHYPTLDGMNGRIVISW